MIDLEAFRAKVALLARELGVLDLELGTVTQDDRHERCRVGGAVDRTVEALAHEDVGEPALRLGFLEAQLGVRMEVLVERFKPGVYLVHQRGQAPGCGRLRSSRWHQG